MKDKILFACLIETSSTIEIFTKQMLQLPLKHPLHPLTPPPLSTPNNSRSLFILYQMTLGIQQVTGFELVVEPFAARRDHCRALWQELCYHVQESVPWPSKLHAKSLWDHSANVSIGGAQDTSCSKPAKMFHRRLYLCRWNKWAQYKIPYLVFLKYVNNHILILQTIL